MKMTQPNALLFLTAFFISLLVTFYASATELNADYIQRLWSPQDADILQKHKIDRFYEGEAGTNNYYARFFKKDNCIENPLILITGAEDPIPMWFDTVLEGLKRGFKNIYIIEIRGQGQSERVPDNTTNLLHLNDFNAYKSDLISAFRSIEDLDGFKNPVYIISHSTGSLVITNAIKDLQSQLPELTIKSMSFWAPLIKLNINSWFEKSYIRSALSFIHKLYNMCCGLIVAKKFTYTPFAENQLTSDTDKYEKLQRILKGYEMGSSGVSLSWVLGALKASEELRQTHIPTLKVSTLVLKAEEDMIVSNNYDLKSEFIEIQSLPKAKHGLHIESESTFRKAIDMTFSFFLKDGNNCQF